MTTPPTSSTDAVTALARRLDRCPAHEVASVVVEHVRRTVGARDVVLLVANLEQTELVPVPASGSPRSTARGIDEDDGTALRTGEAERSPLEEADTGDGGPAEELWRLPVEHDGERIGVLELVAPTGTDRDLLQALATTAGRALMASARTSDHLESLRRTQLMTPGAELLASVLPPSSAVSGPVSVAALLEPTYSTGGDAYDYALDEDVAHLAIFDATGHGFPAAVVSSIAVAAYRNSRYAEHDLATAYLAMDAVVGDHSGEARFVTGLMLQLDPGTGRVEWLSAGHPCPVLVGADGSLRALEAEPEPPLGTGLAGAATPDVGEDFLEPGDVLVLFTDGITEARDLEGGMLGVAGLAEIVHRLSGAGLTPAELVRQVGVELQERDDVWMSDDATALLVRWDG